MNVTVAGTSPFSVLVSWSTPTLPHGDVLLYTLYIDYLDGSGTHMQTTQQQNASVVGLHPHQLILVQVSATTAAGEGPLSEQVGGRSSEHGNHHVCFMVSECYSLIYSPDIYPPRVTIVANSTQVAGQPHVLMCHVSIISGHSPVINWLDPDGQVLTSNRDITVEVVPVIGAPTTEIQYSLKFHSIHTRHAGVYFCKATVNSFHYTLNTTTTETQVIFVESELMLSPSFLSFCCITFIICNGFVCSSRSTCGYSATK